MKELKNSEIKEFQEFIWGYYEENGRDFPWRNTQNDLHALVAEIMLQQTSYYQVEPFYKSFCEDYEEPEEVINTDLEDLKSYFEGLGLHRRAEYVKSAASYLTRNEEITQEGLLELKGIGRYTANAFLSVHKDRKFPIVDGNVIRVFKDYFDIEENLSQKDEDVWDMAQRLLPDKDVKEYNLGLIDYGAKLYGKNPD